MAPVAEWIMSKCFLSQRARTRRPHDVAFSASKPLNVKHNSKAQQPRNSIAIDLFTDSKFDRSSVNIIIIAIDLFTDSKFDRTCEKLI